MALQVVGKYVIPISKGLVLKTVQSVLLIEIPQSTAGGGGDLREACLWFGLSCSKSGISCGNYVYVHHVNIKGYTGY